MRAVEDTNALREVICQQVSTEQVASRYTHIELFGRGGWFYGLCPMAAHGDETPFYIGRGGGSATSAAAAEMSWSSSFSAEAMAIYPGR